MTSLHYSLMTTRGQESPDQRARMFSSVGVSKILLWPHCQHKRNWYNSSFITQTYGCRGNHGSMNEFITAWDTFNDQAGQIFHNIQQVPKYSSVWWRQRGGWYDGEKEDTWMWARWTPAEPPVCRHCCTAGSALLALACTSFPRIHS